MLARHVGYRDAMNLQSELLSPVQIINSKSMMYCPKTNSLQPFFSLLRGAQNMQFLTSILMPLPILTR